MQLNPGEKSLLAYFPSSTKAQSAKAALEAAGYSIIQVDRVSRYGSTYDTKYNNPIAGQALNQTGLTIFSADASPSGGADARVLMAADPSNNGMASEGYGLAGGNAFLVTVVTHTDHMDKAREILREHGGNI